MFLSEIFRCIYIIYYLVQLMKIYFLKTICNMGELLIFLKINIILVLTNISVIYIYIIELYNELLYFINLLTY